MTINQLVMPPALFSFVFSFGTRVPLFLLLALMSLYSCCPKLVGFFHLPLFLLILLTDIKMIFLLASTCFVGRSQAGTGRGNHGIPLSLLLAFISTEAGPRKAPPTSTPYPQSPSLRDSIIGSNTGGREKSSLFVVP